MNFNYENGRRYHARHNGTRLVADMPTEYFLPNDEVCILSREGVGLSAKGSQAENDRLDLFHHLLVMSCDDRLHLAPLEEPKRILDIGTGTGIWAMEMGESLTE